MDFKMRNISWFGTHSLPVVTSGGSGARPTHRASFIDPVFIICTDAAFPAECNMKKDTGYSALIKSVKQVAADIRGSERSWLSFLENQVVLAPGKHQFVSICWSLLLTGRTSTFSLLKINDQLSSARHLIFSKFDSHQLTKAAASLSSAWSWPWILRPARVGFIRNFGDMARLLL